MKRAHVVHGHVIADRFRAEAIAVVFALVVANDDKHDYGKQDDN